MQENDILGGMTSKGEKMTFSVKKVASMHMGKNWGGENGRLGWRERRE